MTEEARKKIYDAGWDGYFNGKTLEDCPDYPAQEERDEWCCAWLSAQDIDNMDPYAHL
jgi:ribosome modulation factor